MRKIGATAFLIFTLAATALPQAFHFTKYKVESGLSQSAITSISQDKYGRLWFGTNQGLNSYDGSEFNEYRPVSGDQNSIQMNNVVSVFSDDSGYVWAGGVCLEKYDNSTGWFRTFRGGHKYFMVTKIVPDAKNNLWLARSNEGIGYLGRESKKIFRPEKDSVWENVTDLIIDNKGIIWKISNRDAISTAPVEDFYKNGLVTFTTLYQNNIQEMRLLGIEQDTRGNIWIATTKGLYIIDEGRKTIIPASEKYPQLALFSTLSITKFLGMAKAGYGSRLQRTGYSI